MTGGSLQSLVEEDDDEHDVYDDDDDDDDEDEDDFQVPSFGGVLGSMFGTANGPQKAAPKQRRLKHNSDGSEKAHHIERKAMKRFKKSLGRASVELVENRLLHPSALLGVSVLGVYGGRDGVIVLPWR